MFGRQNQAALTPYTFDNRPAAKRGKKLNTDRLGNVGQRKAGTPHGGGGPENFGARNTLQTGVSLYQDQPSWRWEFENDFFGPAAPSTTPVTAGLKANNFREHGDLYGGRQ